MFRTTLMLIGSAAAAACSPGGQSENAVVDDSGAEIRVAAPVTRVVSLAPSLTELLFAIGAGPAVVGRTDWGSYPPAALEVESVGAGMGPNVEVVATRRPDLVLFYASPSNDPAIAQLGTLGIPSVSLRTDSLGDVPRVARIVGALLGRQKEADSAATEFATRLAVAMDAISTDPPACDAAVIVWDSPPMVIGRGSFLTELIELAGGRNVFDDIAGPDAEVSIEAIAARDPDVIVTLGSGRPAYAERQEWQVVEAVRERAFVVIEGSMFEYPSFRSLEAAAELERRLEGCAR